MDQKHAKKRVRRGGQPSASKAEAEAPATSKERDAAARDAAARDAAARDAATRPETPEDYSDPICVCEAEPYWQEIAERLERDS